MTHTSDSAEPWPRGRARHGGADRVGASGVPGALWLAGKRYVAPDPSAALGSLGATTVVCLCEEPELEERWPGYVGWLREGGPGTVWVPVPDFHAPPLEVAAELVGRICTELRRGDGVLIHCGAGYGRSGTLAAAVLIALGSSLDEAVEAVAAARPGAGPEVGAQMDLLRSLSERNGL